MGKGPMTKSKGKGVITSKSGKIATVSGQQFADASERRARKLAGYHSSIHTKNYKKIVLGKNKKK